MAAATRPTCTISSPGPSRTAVPSRRATRTPPAATGPGAGKAPPSSATTTAWACATTTPRSRGTPRTARAAAASTRSGRRAAPGCSTASRPTRHLRGNSMAGKTSIKSKKVAGKAAASQAAAKPALLAGGNPQIAKGYGDAPVQAYIAAMPGWKSDIGKRIDALVERTVPNVYKAVKWNSQMYGIGGDGWFLGILCLSIYIQVAVL